MRRALPLLVFFAFGCSAIIDPDTDRGVAQPPHGLLVEY